MANWPSIPNPDWGLAEEDYKPQVKDEFEANYLQTGPAAARMRGKFALAWELLSETDFQTLKTFFNANQGCSFTFVHPVASTSHTCVFSGNSIQSAWHSAGWRSNVQCPIEEI